MFFHNTLTKRLEEFKPLQEGKVGMYHCGPTVYNYAHIGNLRAYVFADTLRRALEYLGYEVKQVVNVTDIGHLAGDGDEGEDKMAKALRREGKPQTLEAMREVADVYFEAFLKDLNSLNILPAHNFPFASDHIKEDIELIQKLIDKDLTYQTSDGIYFDTSKDSSYGKLGGTSKSDEHSRIGTNSEKKNPRDFALWKFNEELGYKAPFGNGFPGWHIECSAMSMKYLGDTFDIHTGGIDHIPVHHNNEIAQSENATGKSFANFWLHNAFVNLGEDKMAKSEENFITLKTLEEKEINPLAYRYWLLQARYSTPVNFSWQALEGAEQAYTRLVHTWKTLPDGGVAMDEYVQEFRKFIEDDLDTPRALALIWEVLKDEKIEDANKKSTIKEFDQVLGLNLEKSAEDIEIEEKEIASLPENVQKLINDREEARAKKDWASSDALRDRLQELGYSVTDTDHGPRISLI